MLFNGVKGTADIHWGTKEKGKIDLAYVKKQPRRIKTLWEGKKKGDTTCYEWVNSGFRN